MDVLLATFQGVTIEACSTGHVGQVKVFEQLSLLVRTLAAAPPEFVAINRAHTERALHNLVLGEFGSKEGLMTGPFLELVREAFALLYAHGDSKDMLALAGEFQDTVSKSKKGMTSAQAAACMYALAGISRSKGKNLSGHLVDTISIAETTLTPRSKQTLMKLASLAVSSMSQVSASSPALRLAVVEALVDGVTGALEAGRSQWPGALKVLTRASQVKSSVAVRESGVKGLIALARISPEPVDKLGSTIISTLSDPVLSVRMLAAEALGVLLAQYRQGANWSISTLHAAVEAGSMPKKVSLESLSWKTPLHDTLESIVVAFHASSSLDFRQALCRAAVVFLEKLPPARSVDDVQAQIDWSLRFAASDQAPDRSENVACASYILRAGIGARAPERLQLAAATKLAEVGANIEARVGARRCAFIELQHLIATLGEGFTSLVDLCFKACDTVGTETSALFNEATATLRALILAVPESSSAISSKFLEALIMSQADVAKIERPVQALCAIIRAASSINRGGALPSTHLFGMGKALASRHLDQDSDPTGQFGSAGWDLINSLLTLGPSFYSPHLLQLFALWQETFRSSRNENVVASSVSALGGLLRNANEDDFSLLGRAASALLVTIPIGFVSKKSVRLQAAVLECWSKCVATNEAMDSNMLLLALHHLTAPDARTSLLDIGGLLNPQDEVLEYDADTFNCLADGRPADSFMEYHLFRASLTASPQECRDCFDNGADLHALVGRRARSRPSLGLRLKSAGGAGGASNSEAALPPADPRASAFGQTWAQRAVDASVSYFASTFARGDAKTKLETLNALIAKYGGIPHHSSAAASAKVEAQQAVPHKAYNVASTLLACVRMSAEENALDLEQREIADWQTVLRDFLVVFMGNSQAPIRRAAAQALTIFAVSLAPAEILGALQMFLEGVLKNPQDDENANNMRCGALLAAARMRREGKEAFRFAPSEGSVYDACKLTSQPVRVWSLHAWNLLVSSTNPSEAIRYVRPTTALINAHLLTEAGSPTHESTAAHTATMLCLARLCNTVVSCLGPELSTDEERATKLFSVWDLIRKSPSFDIQRQCISFCELFALFHPKFIFEDTYRRAVVSGYVLDRLRAPREGLNAVFSAGVTSVLRLCERDASFASYRSRLYESLERCGRAYPSPSTVVISPTLGPWLLRYTWAKSEMAGAAGPSCSSRWSYFYPPEREEQVCYVTAEMIRTGGTSAVLPWFWFCRDVTTGGAHSQGKNKGGTDQDGNEEGNDEEATAGKAAPPSLSANAALTAEEEEYELAMREPRWQTKTVALEGVHAVVRLARTFGSEHIDLKRAREIRDAEDEPLVKSLESLLSCAGQAATATVGDVGIMTLQSRGLACLSRIVTIFAPQNDPDVPEFPLLRQYEAQLNATLRPGLGPRAQPELAREATVLAANVLITGVSTSARRLIAQLVFKDLLTVESKEQEEEDAVFMARDDEEEEAGEIKGASLLMQPKLEQTAFGAVVDDVSSSGLLLAKCCSLARLALCAAGHASAAFEDDVAASDQVFREDAREAVGKALLPKTHTALVRMWLRIVRDAFVLQYSSTLRAPRRHPDATYESGRTPQDVQALLPAYLEAWPVCAQAAADAVDGPFWTLSENEFHCLVFGCARAVEMDEWPLRAIGTLTTLISKPSWAKLDRSFERELLEVLAARALKASQRGRKPNRDACLRCIAALLSRSAHHLVGDAGESASRLWIKTFETCVQAMGSRSEVLDKVGLAVCCPLPLIPFVLFALNFGAAKRGEPLDGCMRAAEKLPRTDVEQTRATLKQLVDQADATSVVSVMVLTIATQTTLAKSTHEIIIAKMKQEVFGGQNAESKRGLVKAFGDLFRRGHTEQARYYARAVSAEMIAFLGEDRETMETFKGVLEIWARVIVMKGLETEPLVALAVLLADDKAQGGEEKRGIPWGKFFVLVARENPVAFKTLVGRLEPQIKTSLKETVRAVMSRT